MKQIEKKIEYIRVNKCVVFYKWKQKEREEKSIS